jgi:hypothetical protein
MDTEGPCDDPGNDELLKDWKKVDSAMDKLFSKEFRYKYKDSLGRNFKIGWFFLTWTGFKTNPRNRDFGYHKVRDHYKNRWGKELASYGDEECWHYHHPPKSGIGNEWSDDWSSSSEYKNIISRQIIERSWFPVCFRAGGTIMDANLSQWVDEWFPFDYSNRAPLKFPEMDWSGGIEDWQPYTPDPVNFKSKGKGKRKMARCMDLLTGTSVLNDKDILSAFEEASSNGKAIISVFDHDYRDIESRVLDFLSKLNKINKTFKNVDLEYMSPSEAIAKYTNQLRDDNLKLELETLSNHYKISVNKDIHQKCPWLATEDEDGNFKQLEKALKIVSPRTWELPFKEIEDVKKIGIAVSNASRETDILMVQN